MNSDSVSESQSTASRSRGGYCIAPSNKASARQRGSERTADGFAEGDATQDSKSHGEVERVFYPPRTSNGNAMNRQLICWQYAPFLHPLPSLWSARHQPTCNPCRPYNERVSFVPRRGKSGMRRTACIARFRARCCQDPQKTGKAGSPGT